jgi:LysM repeat protein
MKKLVYIIALCAVLSLTIAGPAYADNAGVYVVRPGDTMLRIAARHNLTATQLAAANGLRWNDWVYVGQRLEIPGQDGVDSTPSTPTPSTGSTYVVRPGDTLISIAVRHRVTLAQLARANGLHTNAWVYTGQRLKVPGTGSTTPAPAPAPSTSGTYVVRPGDTLTGIAVRHGVSISRLAAANGLRTNSWVYVGQRLEIPGTGTTPPAPAPGGGKWIDVDLSTQTLTAYQDGQAVFTARVSTGTWRTPTVVGTYRVYVKYVSTRMRGPGYDTPDVPYTMYFYQGYGLHGAYWHDNFGTPMSHGCVNLSVDDARWLYNWAPVGTKVVTHN